MKRGPALICGLLALTVVSGCQTLKMPTLRMQEPVEARGEFVQVEVQTEPFAVLVDGPAELERVNDYTVVYRSESGRMVIPLAPGEAIYGLTERIVDDRARSEDLPQEVGGLDRRGEIVNMWIIPTYSVYAPFYISSRGYGMTVSGTWPGRYDIGASNPNELRVEWETDPAQGFECTFIYGPSYYAILDHYTALTGRPFLPPRWAFDHHRWRDEHHYGPGAMLDGVLLNAELVEDIVMYEKLSIPAGVYWIDRPWAEGTYGYGNFTWDEKRFPHPQAMVAALNKRGYELLLWAAPWALGTSKGELGYEARQKGYLIPGGDRCLDYTNPEVVEWHKDKIYQFMKENGIHGWKLDRSEEYNPSLRRDIYYDGRSGRELHNAYPVMYHKVYYEASKAAQGEDFILISRSGYTGSTQYVVIWGGDIPGARGVGIDTGLRSAIISLQRAAFLGYPVWGSDTGGYVEFKDRDVFARWLQFSALCPLMEIGGKGTHAPWDMPTDPKYDEEMIEIYRKYVTLHHELADYTYQLAVQAHQTGAPIARPLVFDYPEDPRVKDMWDEYLYGPDLLVAPVWRKGQRSREVYLPKGVWLDYWDRSKRYQGPAAITYAAPLDTLPLFIKEETQLMREEK